MRSSAQIASLCASFLFSYVVLTVASLDRFALQAVAFLFLIYVIVKARSKHTTHLFPSLTIEFFLFCSSLFLLIGHTGGIHSLFLPVMFFVLFISIFLLDTTVLFLFGLTIPVFLYAVSTAIVSMQEWSLLISFPLMLPMLLFAHVSYRNHERDTQELSHARTQELSTMLYLSTFLKPKLEHLMNLCEYPEINKENIQKQILLILEETQTLTDQNT